MRHLPGSVLEEKQVVDWAKYIGIDDDGSARAYKKEPEKVGNTWVPKDFSDTPVCYRLEDKYVERFHGRLLKREQEDGDKFFRPIAEK